MAAAALAFESPADFAKLQLSKSPKVFDITIPSEEIFEGFGTRNVKEIIESTDLNYNTSSKVFVKMLKFPTIIIPAGTRVHRADHEGAKYPGADVPAFFGNIKSIEIYSRKNPKAFSHYTFKKQCELLLLDFNTLKNLLSHPDLSESDQEVLMAYFDTENGYVNPMSVLEENVKAFKNSKGKTPLQYLNRHVANIICSLGFHGWIVQPYNPAKRQGIIQFVPSKKVEAPYAPEFMLCKWDDFLTPDPIEGAAAAATTAPSASGAAAAPSKINLNNVDGGRRKTRRRSTRRRTRNRKH